MPFARPDRNGIRGAYRARLDKHTLKFGTMDIIILNICAEEEVAI